MAESLNDQLANHLAAEADYELAKQIEKETRAAVLRKVKVEIEALQSEYREECLQTIALGHAIATIDRLAREEGGE